MFYSVNSLDDIGRGYLNEVRGLSIPECINCGIATKGDEIFFDFRREGKSIRTKWRRGSDKSKQGWLAEKTKEPLPFFNQVKPNASKTHSFAPRINRLIITEGEFDCVALSQLEVCNCVSVHGGASSTAKCIKDNASYLANFDEIYIAFDMDDPGKKAAEVAKGMIDPQKYRRINFPIGSKDANDWLLNENPGPEDLIKLMENAEKLTCDEIVHWQDLPDSIFDPLDKGISTGWYSLDSIIGGLRPGELTVVSADTAAGKTTFCVNLMINIALQNQAIWINSYEMATKVIFRKIASNFLKSKMKFKDFSVDQVHQLKELRKKYPIYINPTQSSPDLLSIAKQLELCTYVHNIKYILIDHFDYIHNTIKTENTFEAINESILALHTMAIRYNVHIVLVAHPRQYNPGNEELSMQHIKGSSSIKQYADNILLLTRMNRINTEDKRTKVRIAKNRLFGTEGDKYLEYSSEIDGFLEIQIDPNTYVHKD